MKFVDDLLNQTPRESAEGEKRDASSIGPRSAAQEVSRLTPEQLAKVEPGLEAFYAYLDEFCQILAQKSPTVLVDYDVLSMTRLTNLGQSDYKLVAENTVVPRFKFSLLCMSKSGCSLSVGTEHELKEVREFLDVNGLRHRVENQSEMRFVVRVEGFVPVDFRFEPHPEKGELRILARNLDRLGASSYSVKPERVSRELMDEFGKRVLRMENQFDRMTGFEVSDDIRARLRQRIAVRQATRETLVSAKAQSKAREPRPKMEGKPTTRGSKLASLFRRNASNSVKNPSAATSGGSFDAAPAGVPAQSSSADVPSYAWVVTRHVPYMESDATVGQLGPKGAAKVYRVNEIILKGRPFRMRDQDGALKYSGHLLGKVAGFEPLEDYGRAHGCTSIEYEQGGFWVRFKRDSA